MRSVLHGNCEDVVPAEAGDEMVGGEKDVLWQIKFDHKQCCIEAVIKFKSIR